MLTVIERIGLVDADIEDVPFEAVGRTFELPVAQDVSQLVAVAQRVVGRAYAPLLAYVDSHETESLILSPTVLCTSAHEALDCAALGHTASKG